MDNKEGFTVNFDMNAFLESYSKEKFMKGVFKEVVKENPEIISKHISSQIIIEIMQSDGYQTIKEGVSGYITEALTRPHNSHLSSSLNRISNECVEENKPKINQKVMEAISQSGFRDDTAKKISRVVEEKIMRGFDRVE